MATGDILFLLLFIVLPTAVIVSGIWAIVFVRLRPPAGRVVASAAASETAEPIALAAPAAEPTLSLAAVAPADTIDNALEHGYADPVAPVLSEREAIANIDPLAADLLFDQPLPPPPAPAPFTDRAPTEEMPAVKHAVSAPHVSLPAGVPAEETATADAQVADAEAGEPHEPATALGGTPVELEHPGGTDDLDPERAGVGSLEPDEAEDLGADQVLDDGVAVAEPELVDAVAADAPADDGVADEDLPADTDAKAPAEQQARRRGPLRLIPSDENDPRERRRARSSGRRAPQLPRSIRRNERGV